MLSCSKNKKQVQLEDRLSAFVENTNNVWAFGSVDAMAILHKAEYKQIPKAGPVIEGFVKELESSLVLKNGVYFALYATSEEQQDPSVFGLISVKDRDSLKTVMMQKGFDFDTKNGIDFAQDGDVSFAIQDDVFAILIQNARVSDPNALVAALNKCGLESKDKKVRKHAERKGDIHVTLVPENTSKRGLASLNPEMQKIAIKMAELQKDSYNDVSIFFEKGELRVEMLPDPNEKLSSLNFTLEDNSANIRTKLGGGKPLAAVAINLDMRAIQDFLEKETGYTLLEILEMNKVNTGEIDLFTGGKIANVIDGTAGGALYLKMDEFGGMLPLFNGYADLGPKGKEVFSMLLANMETSENMIMEMNDDYLKIYSDSINGNNEITVPKSCSTFGKHGFTMYADFSDMDLTMFDLYGPQSMIELVEYVNIWADMKEGEMVLKLRNKEVNVLKQVVDQLLVLFENEISNLGGPGI